MGLAPEAVKEVHDCVCMQHLMSWCTIEPGYKHNFVVTMTSARGKGKDKQSQSIPDYVVFTTHTHNIQICQCKALKNSNFKN